MATKLDYDFGPSYPQEVHLTDTFLLRVHKNEDENLHKFHLFFFLCFHLSLFLPLSLFYK